MTSRLKKMERQLWSLKEVFGDFERKTSGQKN